MQYKIRQLEAFRAVSDTGSITKAASKLGISQPATSRLLADFSKAVGFTLFDRSLGNLVPSTKAQYLLGEINRILDSLEHLDELRRDLTERTGTHLRIACLPGFATNHLPKVLVDFLADHPDVTATLEPDRPERILEWILHEHYDVAITDGFFGHRGMVSQDIRIPAVCILPTGHALEEKDVITPNDLQDERLIHTRRDSSFYLHLNQAFQAENVVLNGIVEVRQFSAACRLVEEGLGVSVVSKLDANAADPQALVARPFKPDISHKLTVLRPISGANPRTAIAFSEAFIRSLDSLKLPD